MKIIQLIKSAEFVFWIWFCSSVGETVRVNQDTLGHKSTWNSEFHSLHQGICVVFPWIENEAITVYLMDINRPSTKNWLAEGPFSWCILILDSLREEKVELLIPRIPTIFGTLRGPPSDTCSWWLIQQPQCLHCKRQWNILVELCTNKLWLPR